MTKQNSTLKKETTSASKKTHQRPHFSKAMLTIAKTNLKEFETQTDEGFLIRNVSGKMRQFLGRTSLEIIVP